MDQQPSATAPVCRHCLSRQTSKADPGPRAIAVAKAKPKKQPKPKSAAVVKALAKEGLVASKVYTATVAQKSVQEEEAQPIRSEALVASDCVVVVVASSLCLGVRMVVILLGCVMTDV